MQNKPKLKVGDKIWRTQINDARFDIACSLVEDEILEIKIDKNYKENGYKKGNSDTIILKNEGNEWGLKFFQKWLNKNTYFLTKKAAQKSQIQHLKRSRLNISKLIYRIKWEIENAN